MSSNPFDEIHAKDVAVASPTANPFEATHAADIAPKAPKEVAMDTATGFMGHALSNLARVHAAAHAAGNAMSFGLGDRIRGMLFPGSSHEKEKAYSEKLAKDYPAETVAGHIAGTMAPARGISGALGAALPALGKMTMPSIIANQAATSGIMSAGEDIGKGEIPDVGKALTSAGIGGITGGAIHGVGQVLSPAARIRAAGSNLTAEDIAGMRAAGDKAARVGIPLSVPEMAAGGAPGSKYGALARIMSTGKATGKGAEHAFDFNNARAPLIQKAAGDIATEASQGTTAPGLSASMAASNAIKSAKDLVRQSAEPHFKQAENVFVKGAPKTPEIERAAGQVEKSPAKMAEIGKRPKHSVKFLDTVQQQMDTNLGKAKNAGDRPLARIIERDKGLLRDSIEKSAPAQATGRQIAEQGKEQLVKPLQSGPLGHISSTNEPGSQARSLLDVGTPAEEAAAVDAAKRMPESVSKGLAAHWLTRLASRDATDIGSKFAPTEHAKNVVRSIFGNEPPKLDRIESLIDTLSAIRNSSKNTAVGASRGTGVGAVTHPKLELLKEFLTHNQGKAVELLQDPKTLAILGKIGPIQQTMMAGGSAAAPKLGKTGAKASVPMTKSLLNLLGL